ncbi:MAG TPA: hypothetical protein VMO17_02200 [Terriglobia bacterium]|nr:hypothetical protein [Terriglobia bacterium]
MPSLPGQNSVLCRILTAVLIMVTLGLSVASGKKHTPPAPAGLPAQINALAKQLPGVMLEDAGPIIGQIQKLVVDHMAEWMANRAPTDVEVRRELESVFSLLHYPEVATPAAFAFPWKGKMVIGAGYTLGWTDFDRQNVVAIFTSSGGKSHLVTVTNFIPRTDLHYEGLPQLAWDDFRFFIWGDRLGKSQLRLSVVLYSFDGHTLKSLWESRDMYDGEMNVMKDKVTIAYLKEDEYIHAVQRKDKPPRYLATYQLTAAGIQLLEVHEIPF